MGGGGENGFPKKSWEKTALEILQRRATPWGSMDNTNTGQQVSEDTICDSYCPRAHVFVRGLRTAATSVSQ